ncbi:hypothetical protein [Chromobacterium paludis]|uniref:Uncharacterized protein n=1 Tax=Chromobacterium paludis TaxID=2605945 RepID=A0A5C1DKC0_9NEIS|nr:hypothetical protein [Chromobacterium paludis]QEL57145.1 hypothetical protein FYK34_17065 [Chromobacterium paludis]
MKRCAPLLAGLLLAAGLAQAQDANTRPFDSTVVLPSVPLSLHELNQPTQPSDVVAPPSR